MRAYVCSTRRIHMYEREIVRMYMYMVLILLKSTYRIL